MTVTKSPCRSGSQQGGRAAGGAERGARLNKDSRESDAFHVSRRQTDLVKAPLHHGAGAQNLGLGTCCFYVLKVLLPNLNNQKKKKKLKVISSQKPLQWNGDRPRYLIPHFQDVLWVGVHWNELVGDCSLADAVVL